MGRWHSTLSTALAGVRCLAHCLRCLLLWIQACFDASSSPQKATKLKISLLHVFIPLLVF